MSAFLPDWYFLVVALLMGSAAGSFANVVIYRVPKGASLWGRSVCPSCGKQIAWYDNLPLISFLVLAGRCRACRSPISVRYPLVELSVGVLWMLVTWKLGVVAVLPAFLIFSTALVILSAVDFEHHRLPNKILYPAAVAAIFLLLTAAAVEGNWERMLRSLVGAAAYGVPILGIGLAFPSGMGGGDIKLAGYLGLHLGWFGLRHVLVGALLGVLLGGVAATALLVAGRKGRKDPIPFGPFMATGALAATLAGRQILKFWLG